MSKKPRQKVVLITGASTGIGRATAKLLASNGYQVYGGVRSPERVEPLPGVELVRIDVRDDASVAAGVEAVLRKAGFQRVVFHFATGGVSVPIYRE